MTTSSTERILTAAIACFSQRGMQVSMEDVALHAGVTRRTLYRTFSDRRALIEAVAIARLDKVLKKVRPRLEAQRNFADALVVGFVQFVRYARADTLFMAALDEASDWHLERFLVGPSEPFVKRAEGLWRKTMEQATTAQEWRSGLDLAEINGWLRAVAVILLLRDDLDARGQEQLVRNFVIPALVTSKAKAKSV